MNAKALTLNMNRKRVFNYHSSRNWRTSSSRMEWGSKMPHIYLKGALV